MTFRESIRHRGRRVVPFHDHDGGDISGEIVASVIKVVHLLGGTITGEEIIIAGGVNGILRSDNFVAGSAGWRARGDGTFEAQDGIFRGTLNADDVTAGTLDVDRLGAGTIQVEKLVVGSFDNLITNPGFEADIIEGPLDPHNYAAGSGGTWSSAAGTPRSGGRAARFDVDSQTAVARIFLNGDAADLNMHPSVAQGDVLFSEFFARTIGTGSHPNVFARISWYDEAGVLLSSTDGSDLVLTSSYIKATVEGIAPAGVAYAVLIAQIKTGGDSTAAILFDDCYARRMVGTSIIEDLAVTNAKIGALAVTEAKIGALAVTNAKIGDLAVDTAEIATAAITKLKIGDQEVDIQRMLDPVYAEAKNGASSNVSLSTTTADMASVTMTIPSWVGTAYTVSTATIQMSASATHGLILEIGSGGTDFSSRQASATSGETLAMSTTHTRTIVSPGSTLVVKSRGTLSSGTNSSNASIIATYLSGIR